MASLKSLHSFQLVQYFNQLTNSKGVHLSEGKGCGGGHTLIIDM